MDSSDEQRRRLERIAAMPDDQIDTSDIPEVLDWSRATRGGFPHELARAGTVSVDADLLEWFRANGEQDGDLQHTINRVLRDYVERAQSA